LAPSVLFARRQRSAQEATALSENLVVEVRAVGKTSRGPNLKRLDLRNEIL